jgi:CheY-like chemotaxis protein
MPKRRVRILVVEDQEATAYLVEQAFHEKSANVDWDLCFAKDGEDALDCLFKRGPHSEALPPDLVLLDWNLPKVSGREVLRLLKGSEDLSSVPVLVFSSSEADEDIHIAYKEHANGYIPKPSDLESLYAVIDSIEMFWVRTARLPSAPMKSAGTAGGRGVNGESLIADHV